MTTGTADEKLTWLGRGTGALADQGLLAGAGFAVTVLLARWLPPEQYGAYALAFTTFLFISGFHNALLLEPMSVLGPATYGKTLPAYMRTVLRMHFGLTVFLSLLVALAGIVLREFAPGSLLPPALFGVSLGLPFILLFWLCRRASYLGCNSLLPVAGSAAYGATAVSLVLLFERFGWLSPFVAFLLLGAGASTASILLPVSFHHHFTAPSVIVPIRAVLNEHWRYGRWVVVTASVYWISSGAYYFIVGGLLRIEDVAALRSLQNFASPLPQFLTAMGLFLLPAASARYAEQGETKLRGSTTKIVAFFAAGGMLYMLGLLLFGSWLFHRLYGGRYSEFVGLIPLVALPIPVLAAAEGFSIALRAMQAPVEVLRAYTAAALVTILAGLGLTYRWGLRGALLGMVISSLAFMVTIASRYYARTKHDTPVEVRKEADSSVQGIRVAWLMPSLERGYYWQPVFREFTRIFPNTVIFTGLWPGFVPGLEGTFSICLLDGIRFVTLKRGTTGYESSFAWPPLSVFYKLLRFRPHVMFVSGFNLWTLYGVCLKPFIGFRIVLLWDGVSPAMAYLHAPVRLRIRRLMACFFDECISNTREGVHYLSSVLGVPDSRLRQHPYEVPSATLLCSKNGQTDVSKLPANVTFLYVGQLIQRKGVENLLRACSLLKEKPMTTFSAIIVGEGEQGDELRELANELGLKDQVHWVGKVEYEALGTYYRACDVFVFPTHEDIWGMVPLEAMVFGKAVLCSKFAGSSEMISHGINGFVFDPNNAQELAHYMARFIREPQLMERFGEASKQLISPYTPGLAASVLAATVARVLRRISSPPDVPEEVSA